MIVIIFMGIEFPMSETRRPPLLASYLFTATYMLKAIFVLYFCMEAFMRCHLIGAGH
jgi:hypothetical protein